MKKRDRPSTSKSKEAAGSQNPNPKRGQIDDHSMVFNGFEEGTASVSIQEHAAAAASASEIIETPSSSSVSRDDDSAESFGNLTEETVGASNLSLNNEDDDIYRVRTINLSYQLAENALMLLNIFLLNCATDAYVRELRVITNSSQCNKAIVEFLETEKIEWKEENKTTLRIKVNGNKNLMTINLRGQLAEPVMELLKPLILLCLYGRYLRELKIITGSARSSNLKQAVVEFLEREKMDWQEENKATLVIKFYSD